MSRTARKKFGFRPEKMAPFLEAAYCLDTDNQAWLREVMTTARAVCGRGGPVHAAIYDASDIAAFCHKHVDAIDFPDEGVAWLQKAPPLFTAAFVARSFRSRLFARSARRVGLPEVRPFFDGMAALGLRDHWAINGLDPSGQGVFLGLWMSEPAELPVSEMAVYRRIAHHLGAAHRCRRRLRESQAERSTLDPTEGAEAILDARRRIVHASGPAQAKDMQSELIEASAARDLARSTRSGANSGLQRWRPLSSARWTFVDSFERGGARYVVARENQTEVKGLASLSDRERQVVAFLAIGQSTKEIAYALGISDVTVRVLLARAASKLRVRSRSGLLEHPEVRPLRPEPPSRRSE